MAIHRIECVTDRAEGLCCGFPYNTEIVSINGVWFHVWLGHAAPTQQLLRALEIAARRQRDIVRLTYSAGQPTGFWAHQNFD